MLITLAFLWGCSTSKEPTPDSLRRIVDATPVLGSADEHTVTLSGKVRAAEQSALSFEIGGEILEILVDVGDRVEAGQVVARLDGSRYRLARELALANEGEARAAFRESQVNYERQSRLYERGLISQSRLDAARAAADSARARHDSARAARKLADRDLELTALKAPYAGSISERLAEPSERISPNRVILKVISHREGFEVLTSVPENLVGRIQSSRLHNILLPAIGVDQASARIRHLGTQSLSSNSYPLILEIKQSIPGIFSGMTAQIELYVEREISLAIKDQVMVPLTSLSYGADGVIQVLRITELERLEWVDVEVHSMGETHAVVSGPLAVGEQIVARGVEFLSEGEAVTLLGQGPEKYN